MTVRVLEIGYGGRPMKMPPESMAAFVSRLPPQVEYFGVDRLPALASEEQLRQSLVASLEGLRRLRHDTGYRDESIPSAPDLLPSKPAMLWHMDLIFLPRMRILADQISQAEDHLRNIQAANVHLSCMDADDLRFPDGHFDEVHMHYVLTDPLLTMSQQQESVLRQAMRVLHSGGRMIVTGEWHHGSYDRKDHESRDLALEILREEGFHIEHEGLDYAADDLLRSTTMMGSYLLDWKNGFRRKNPSGQSTLEDIEFIIIATKHDD